MKKYSVSFEYDEERINALKKYLEGKDSNLETEIFKVVDNLYNKTVPAGVREYLDLMAGVEPSLKKPPTKRPHPERTDENGDRQ